METLPIAWSTFAPEVAMTVGVVTLMLLAVAGRHRMWLATPLGLGITVGGVMLLNTGVHPILGYLTIVSGVGLIALTFGLAGAPRVLHSWVAGASAGIALLLSGWQALDVMGGLDGPLRPITAMGGSVALDGIAVFTRLTVYLATLLVIPIGHAYLQERRIHRPDFEPLLLLSATGMALLGAANDFITLFVALEVLSISLYVLAGMARRDRRSMEAATKYFVLGAVASALLLYGFALAYVATGSVDLPGVATAITDPDTPVRLLSVALVLVLVGVGFKVALVPFQLWVPDVYQGAPTNVTAFMGGATKAAGFAALLRLLLVTFAPLQDLWIPVVAVLAAVTMLYGAYAALRQVDVKRVLAYSAIAHAGYATIGVVSNSDAGLSATLWYLLTYAISSVAAFGSVVAIERRTKRLVTVADLRGLGRVSPMLAGILSVSLLSLAGIPPTIGFAGKLAVFTAGVQADLMWLVVIGVVSSVVAAYYYLRLMGAMFLHEPTEDTLEPAYSHGWNIGVTAAAALVVYLGLQPQLLLDLADKAATMAR